ncbi:MAG TPA: hypothetical protein VNN55_08350 [bacterium]|nr:hypothetical protein [bacterium]
MRRIKTLIIAAMLSGGGAEAQAVPSSEPTAIGIIADNSFFIEEAYNQEPGVAQHVLAAAHFPAPRSTWSMALTGEFPLHTQRHQGSWTLVFASSGAQDNLRPADLLLSYRLQLDDGAGGVAIAPRVSLIVPLSDERSSVGNWSFQSNLPVSIDQLRPLVAHVNAGATYTPCREVRSGGAGGYVPGTRDLIDYNLGASLALLIHPQVNVMFEAVRAWTGYVNRHGRAAHASETVVCPGTRAAINTAAGQIVPGLGLPIRWSDEGRDVGLFLYLSFEHANNYRLHAR